jgi:hypothetical protein
MSLVQKGMAEKRLKPVRYAADNYSWCFSFPAPLGADMVKGRRGGENFA